MKPAHILLAAGTIGAIGIFFPREIHLRSPDRETVIVESAKPPVVQSFNWYGGETVLERASDGHFYAQAQVDGQSMLFLVDTGASMVALSGEDAAALGLEWDAGDLRPVGRGAGGIVYGINTTVGEIALGSFRSSNVPAVIVPEGLPVSLLGQSFLAQVENVEITGERMVLSGTQ